MANVHLLVMDGARHRHCQPGDTMSHGGVQILCQQQPAIADPGVSPPSLQTAIIDILTALRTHGLIASE